MHDFPVLDHEILFAQKIFVFISWVALPIAWSIGCIFAAVAHHTFYDFGVVYIRKKLAAISSDVVG